MLSGFLRLPIVRIAPFALVLAVGSPAAAQRGAAGKPAPPPPAAEKKVEAQKKEDKDRQSQTAISEDERRRAQQTGKKSEEEPDKKAFDDTKESPRAVYFSGDLAFTRPDVAGLSDNTAFDRTGANGVLYGLSAGYRHQDLRLGGRWRVADTTEFALWSLAVSAGYGLPLRPLSPVFSAHVGYVWSQHIEPATIRSSLPPGNVLAPDVNLRGLLVGIDVNAAFWIAKFLRVGPFVGADLMVLNRAQADQPTSTLGVPNEFRQKPLYTDDGSGLGVTMNLGMRGSFDIGF